MGSNETPSGPWLTSDAPPLDHDGRRTLVDVIRRGLSTHPWICIATVLGPFFPLAISAEFGYPADWLLLGYGTAVIVFMMAIPNLSSALAERRASILFLRRFNTERAPLYPVSRVLDQLVCRGYEVVTLRDQVVDRDRETMRPASVLSAVVGGWVISMCLAVGLCWALIWMMYELDTNPEFERFLAAAPAWIGFISAVTVAGSLGLYALKKQIGLSDVVIGTMKVISNTVMSIVTSSARSVSTSRYNRGAYRRRGQLGMSVVAASDSTWERTVADILVHCDIVIVDLSFPSTNIAIEVAMISKQESCIPIWLRSSSGRSLVHRAPETYTVLSTRFNGAPVEVVYPPTSTSELYSHFDPSGVSGNSLYEAANALSLTIESALTQTSACRTSQGCLKVAGSETN